MPYDPALPKKPRPHRWPDALTSPVDKPWKAENLAGFTGGAAMIIVFNHVSSILFSGTQIKPTLVGVSHIAMANIVAGALSALFMLVARYRQPIWVAWVILIWSIFECTSPLPYRLYGHVSIFRLSAMGVLFSIIGVRGAVALRAFERRGEYVRGRKGLGRPLVLSGAEPESRS